MTKNKKILILIGIIVGAIVVVRGFFLTEKTTLNQNLNVPLLINDKKQQDMAVEKQTTERLEQYQSSLLSEEWVPFTNMRFHYIFEHPKSLKEVESGGRGADFSSDVGSIVTFAIGDTGIFNVMRLYLDEKSIHGGILANIEQMRSEKYSDAYIKEYPIKINREFAETRKYRDISFKLFAELIQKETMLGVGTSTDKQNTSLRETVVDGLPAYEFTWVADSQQSDVAISLKLGYGFLSSFGTHRFVFFESPAGEKYYIHYQPTNPVSDRMFKSFHFVR
jgi:hypothetical protein